MRQITECGNVSLLMLSNSQTNKAHTIDVAVYIICWLDVFTETNKYLPFEPWLMLSLAPHMRPSTIFHWHVSKLIAIPELTVFVYCAP